MGRCKFGRSSNGYAVIKVEGVLPSDPGTVYHFLNISTKQGGKVREREREGRVREVREMGREGRVREVRERGKKGE